MSKKGQHEKARECLEAAFAVEKQQYGYRETIVLQLAYATSVEGISWAAVMCASAN